MGETQTATISSAPRAGFDHAAWFWAALAVLPFWLPYVAHFQRFDAVPTGYLFYDMPYYAANGRAVFERGNGLAGPNPYDSDADAPAIYFHWYTWLLGLGVAGLGFDPGVWSLCLGALGGLACSRLTFALVRGVLPGHAWTGPLVLLAMWGGGLLVLARLTGNLAAGRALLDNPLAYDPFGGEWALYWGRTLIYPTEAVYHALVAAAWLAVLRDQPRRGAVWAALLAATHPFSGLQLLAILGAWWIVRGPNGWRDWAWRSEGLLLCCITAAFLGYYFVYLESYPQHRLLRVTWTLDWNTPLSAQALAYGPVLLLALARLRNGARRAEPLPQGIRFLLIAAAISLALSNHHWLFRSHQPLHFTRGYVWLPLLLVGLAELQRWLATYGRAGLTALLVVLALAAVDNLTFLGTTIARPSGGPFVLTVSEWDVLSAVRDRGERGVLLSEDRRLGYLAATYTSARPYLGHEWNTPDWRRRNAEVTGWFERGGDAPWLARVDLILMRRNTYADLGTSLGLTSPDWEVLYQNRDFVLLGRAQAGATPARRLTNGGR